MMKVKVKEILEKKGRKVITINASNTVHEAVDLMNKNKIGALLVLDKKKKLVGIITERDILHEVVKLTKSIDKTKVENVMTKNLIIGLPDDEVQYLMGIMTENKIRHMPIMERDNIAGIISIGDLVQHLLEDVEFKNRYLEQYIQSG
jgi:CBS domain-containing protein